MSSLPTNTSLSERYYSLISPTSGRKTLWGLGASAEDPEQQGLTTKIVDLILEQAVIEGASDVHLEPEQGNTKLRVRYRIDGVLYEKLFMDHNPNVSIIPRIKIMANLETDARLMRKPQDGRFSIKAGSATLDFRVSTFPTVQGEKIAIRILYKDAGLFKLDKIGFDPFDLSRVARLLQYRYGLFLVSGPTGCGKTTTLYAILSQLNSPGNNIITLEDPVEYQIEGMNQCDIRKKMDFNFADGLRASLRQDPDIILVGEIRDNETAEIAIRASLTGHMVFSTLHTNSAIGTIIRLVNMGLEPYLVSYALISVISQRLVRKICDHCKEQYTMTPEELNRIKMHYKINASQQKAKEESYYSLDQSKSTVFYRGKGCSHCVGTGYKGRIGLFEIVVFNDELRDAIIKGASSSDLRQIAIRNGTKLLIVDGLEKAKSGVTTLDEVFTVAFER